MQAQIKTLAAFAVGLFGVLSQLFILFGYTPPIPLDKLLHLSQEQITCFGALALAFLTPVHTVTWDFLVILKGIFQRDNTAANAAYEKLQADFGNLAKLVVYLQAQVEAKTVPPAPPAAAAAAPALAPVPQAQAGRGGLWALCLVAIISVASLFSLHGCASAGLTAPKSVPQTLAYTEAGVTAVRQTAATLLQAGQISTTTAEGVQTSADQAAAALRLARSASAAGDVATASAQLQVATQILTALQAALPAAGH